MCRHRLLCRCSARDRVRAVAAYSFGFPPPHSRWPYSARCWECGWECGWSFLGVRGGVAGAHRAVPSPRSYPCLLQFRFPSRVRIRIRVPLRCSFGPFYAAQRRAVPLSGRSYGRRRPLLLRHWHRRHRRHHHQRIWGAGMQISGVS